jgi:hypothetical protein
MGGQMGNHVTSSAFGVFAECNVMEDALGLLAVGFAFF